MRTRFGKTTSIVLSALLVLSLFLFVFNVGTEQASGAGPPPPGAVAYSPHDCIRIEGDAQFLINATAEGWSGNGSALNPFIIEGYEIDAHGAYNCIFITNTSYHFVIRDCLLSNTTHAGAIVTNGAGVLLWNVTDSTVQRITMIDSGQLGTYAIDCDGVSILDNRFENRAWSIVLVSTNESIVSGNHIKNGGGGGLALETYGSPDRGFGCNNNTLQGNDLVNVTYGFIVWMGPHNNDNTIKANSFLDCNYSIYVSHFNDSLIANNSITGGVWGIYQAASGTFRVDDNLVENNTIESTSENGIRLVAASGNVFHDNLIADSGTYGMNLTNCDENLIYRNIFVNNNNSGPSHDPIKMQAYDDSDNNLWFSSGIGNYWSDWTTPDANHDGIVDLQYPVGGGNTFDYFPLTVFVEAPGDLGYSTGEAWVDLDWDAPSISLGSDVVEYNITKTSGLEVTTITIPGTETSYNDTNVISWEEYTYSVVAVTSVGESTPSNDVTVRVPDETSPTIDITSPADGARISAHDILVEWTGTDDVSGIRNYTVQVSGEEPIDVDTNTSYMFASLPDGEYSVTVRAFDNASNNNSQVVSFVVDTTAPTVVDADPRGQDVLADAIMTVTFSEPMNVTSVEFTVSGGVTGAITWSGNVATFDPSVDLDYATEYTINLEGEDLVGNPLAAYSWSFNTTDTGVVEGVVQDSEGNPIAGANVILGTGEHTTTDSDGEFSMRAPPGYNNLTISKDGYNDKVLDVTVVTGESDDLGTITMEKSSNMTLIIIIVVVVAAAVIGVVAFLAIRRRK